MLDCLHREDGSPYFRLSLSCLNLHLLSVTLSTLLRSQLSLLDMFFVAIEELLLSSLEAVPSPGWTILAPSATRYFGGHALDLFQLISVL